MKIKDQESECFRYIRMNIEDVNQAGKEGREYITGMLDLATELHLLTSNEISKLIDLGNEKARGVVHVSVSFLYH